ncbi:MAG TPA: alpha/beta fold hydrolase [Candidatus Eisenbacteria bacterium]
MSAPPRVVKPVRFRGPEGLLEGLWADPGAPPAGPPPGAAVICHPHPAHGGSMHSKVVHTIYRVLNDAGHPTLRFNFRGVGASEGSYSGWDGEVGDVAAAAAYARGESGRRPLWLAGFSFGSWVVSRWALGDPDVERMILLGVPVERNVDDRAFDHLTRLPAPTLIVQGEHDQYGSVAGVTALRDRLAPLGTVDVRVVPGADHFFTGKLSELKTALEEGLGIP